MASDRLLQEPHLGCLIGINEADRHTGRAISALIDRITLENTTDRGRTAPSAWIEQLASDKITPQLPTMEDDTTLSDPSREMAHKSPPVTFTDRDPLQQSFPTVILPAQFSTFARGEIIDVDDIHKLRHSHLVYCDNLDSMPFLRGKGGVPFKHAKVKTLLGNIKEIFGGSAPKTVPTELELHLYEYNRTKSFWAVKIGTKYVIVKGGGAFWRPWLGPEEGFHWLGVANAVGLYAGEAYESKKKARRERKEANRAARAALAIIGDEGMEKATSVAGTTGENEAGALENSGAMAAVEAGTIEVTMEVGSLGNSVTMATSGTGAVEINETGALENSDNGN